MSPPELEVDHVTARTASVLAEALYWFPVRHHSPSVALFVERAIARRAPEVIFLEAPSEAQSLLKHVVDKRTRPPVAIYSSYRDDDNVLGLAGIASPSPDIPAKLASFYPLLAYSPEYVVLREAAERGIDVCFMDLPHYATVEPRRPDRDEDDDDDDGAPRAPTVAPGPAQDWQRYVEGSRFYRRLAEAGGYRSWDEAWDALFEVSDRFPDEDAFRQELMHFCAAVRATTPLASMMKDGTIARERFMWRTIQQGLAARGLRAEQAMVVCGGFHVFMDREDLEPPPDPPRGTVYSTLTPYSYFRMSEASGYGAGNRAPAYYERLHAARAASGEALGVAGAATVAMIEHVVDALRRGRKAEESVSSADAIAIADHARMLAKLRGRAAPLLDDIRDAIVTCCCKGRPDEEGVHLARAMRESEIGSAIGRVTPDIGQLPLLHDFYAKLEEHELAAALDKEKRLDVVLDLRDAPQAARSAFLHRLSFLKVPFATLRDRGAKGATMFRETWRIAWSPSVEPELMEKNLYGDTVEAAAMALLEEQIAETEAHAGPTCERLLGSVSMDLPALVLHLYDKCSEAIEDDGSFASLAEAVGHLGILDRMAAHRELSRDLVRHLLGRAFDRAAFAIPTVASVPSEDRPAVVHGLRVLAEALLADEDGLFDRDVLVAGLRAAGSDSTIPHMRGVFDGLLAETRAEGPEFLGGRLMAFAKERPDVLVTAGAYLDGVLSVSHTSVMLGAGALVAALDELFKIAAWDAFVLMLPELRSAFERLHARHRDTISSRVAERHGLKDADAIAKLGTSSVEGAVALAEIDRMTATIMEEWLR